MSRFNTVRYNFGGKATPAGPASYSFRSTGKGRFGDKKSYAGSRAGIGHAPTHVYKAKPGMSPRPPVFGTPLAFQLPRRSTATTTRPSLMTRIGQRARSAAAVLGF
jgi:hypothetical protein